ncbi:hypothetical protein AB0K00_09705 [Dactylosporangium sp. NPDC049525]|uniref:hypothetical protein n=1 Tax=Dactylosporangium sp. NPDC049525 TaxID=3154730 RepID=UPI003430FC14
MLRRHRRKYPTPCRGICRHTDGSPRVLLDPDVAADINAVLRRFPSTTSTVPAPAVDYRAVVSCPVREQLIARAYLRSPMFSRAALPSYRAFRLDTQRQFDLLTRPAGRGGVGLDVRITSEDPYEDAVEMIADLRRGRLDIFSTAACGNPHPWLSDDDNDMFRAVHDVFGHAAAGRGFDRHGEEAAWLKHVRIYSPAARSALTAETRGQSSVVFAGLAEGFPVQKLIRLPRRFTDPAQFSVAR